MEYQVWNFLFSFFQFLWVPIILSGLIWVGVGKKAGKIAFGVSFLLLMLFVPIIMKNNAPKVTVEDTLTNKENPYAKGEIVDVSPPDLNQKDLDEYREYMNENENLVPMGE